MQRRAQRERAAGRVHRLDLDALRGRPPAHALQISAVALLDGRIVHRVHEGEVSGVEVRRGGSDGQRGRVLRARGREVVRRPTVASGVPVGADREHRAATALHDRRAGGSALRAGAA